MCALFRYGTPPSAGEYGNSELCVCVLLDPFWWSLMKCYYICYPNSHFHDPDFRFAVHTLKIVPGTCATTVHIWVPLPPPISSRSRFIHVEISSDDHRPQLMVVRICSVAESRCFYYPLLSLLGPPGKTIFGKVLEKTCTLK